jgi:hypothetical protein
MAFKQVLPIILTISVLATLDALKRPITALSVVGFSSFSQKSSRHKLKHGGRHFQIKTSKAIDAYPYQDL